MTSLRMAEAGRAFLAILAGFATMTILSAATAGAISRFSAQRGGRDRRSGFRSLLLTAAYQAVFAAFGGYVTGAVGSDPLRSLMMLAIVVLLINGLSALQLRHQQSLGYQFSLIVLLPIATLAGGLLEMWVAGRFGRPF